MLDSARLTQVLVVSPLIAVSISNEKAMQCSVLTWKEIPLPYHVIVDALATFAVGFICVFFGDEILDEYASIAFEQTDNVVKRCVCSYGLHAGRKFRIN